MAHRVMSPRCGIWSLSGHSGLWAAARSADLCVHGLVNPPAGSRSGAELINKNLQGARPSYIPVEQRSELVINVQTAKSIGPAILESFRADEVVE